MSRIVESLYGKYNLKEDIEEDVIYDFEDEFSPDGDYDSEYVAHDEDELNSWVNWCDSRGVDYSYDIIDDIDDGFFGEYYAYFNLVG